MIIDGRKIASGIREKLKLEMQNSSKSLTLHIFASDGDLAARQFVRIKKKFAEDLGIEVIEEKLSSEISTDKFIEKIKNITTGGIVIQLPLPENMDLQRILNTIPKNLDIDALSESSIEDFKNGTLTIMPPVVGAIKEIMDKCQMSVRGKKTVIVGKGRLVGKLSAIWLRNNGADVFTADSKTGDLSKHTKKADIIVSGAGIPNLITPDMIKEGAALFDAGASETGGNIAGDADPRCASKCSIFTPVPGGIGPIAVAVLFRNLFTLAAR